MELYAGMVENMDYHVGRLIDHLKKIGEYDNTIFIVFGDNGAEGTDLFAHDRGLGRHAPLPLRGDQLVADPSNAWGDPHSYVGYGPMWAQVSMTPFSQYKGWLAEGGIRNALIVSGPIVKRPKGSINSGLHACGRHHADAARSRRRQYPKTVNGQELPPLIGKSWVKTLAGQAESPRSDQDYLAWEIFGNRAVRQGDWKLRWQLQAVRQGDWELFNLAEDPAERKDLAAQNPDKVKAMLALWDDYVRANNVILPSRGPYDTLEKDMPPARDPVDPGFPPLIYQRQFVPPQGHAGRTQAAEALPLRNSNQSSRRMELFMENTNSLKPAKPGLRSSPPPPCSPWACFAQIAQAQMPARFYWKTLDRGECRAGDRQFDQRQYEPVR
jgi:arylsulfatase A-like enzyme